MRTVDLHEYEEKGSLDVTLRITFCGKLDGITAITPCDES